MQVIGFIVLLVTSLGFIILFMKEGIDLEDNDISLWGNEWGSLFGVVLFNFALVIAVPAWLYEKEPGVEVPNVVHSSSILAAVLYVVIGILGAITMPYVSQNMLESLMSGAFGTTMQLCASIFAFFIVGLGCPLFSVLSRMNLTTIMSYRRANGLAVYLPFLTSWIFYQGDAITQLLSWGGIIFTSLIAFILPLLLALHSLDTSDDEGNVDVYAPLHLPTKQSQRRALIVLLVLAVLSILAAIFGNVFNDDIMAFAEAMNKQ
jgi:Mn2+/Fe2+ NRAMP family transporter